MEEVDAVADEEPADAARIRLMGPTTVVGPDGPITSTRPLECTLLALLASRPGEVVALDTLIDELWGESLPQDPRAALRTQLTRVRAWLADGGLDRGAVPFEHGGYRLAIDRGAVDLTRFADAVARSEGAATPAEAVAACEAALAEWRGTPFAGCAVGLVLEAEQVTRREQRLQVVERRAAALMALDRAPEAVVELAAHRREHPARERLTELLMVALYRMGRQQEALAAYDETRRRLASDHGLVPGPDLARTEAQVLAHDPALLLAREPRVHGRGSRPRPLIVGRDDELSRIAVRLRDGSGGTLAVVTGEAGAGKTTLVGAAAHDAASRGARVGTGAFDEDAPLAGWRHALAELGVDTGILADDAMPRARSVRAALAGLAGARGVVVVLEDAHLADSTSLGMLAGLVRLGLPAGVVVVVTARVPDVATHEAWAATSADLARTPDAVLIGLGPLDRRSADELVATRLTTLDDAAASRVAEVLWRRAGGHPLHLDSLLDVMAGLTSEEDCIAVAERVPDRLRPLVDHQLGSLPEDCRDLVEVLAVVGPTSIEDLATTAGTDPLGALRALRPARDRGLVVDDEGVIGLRHSLTATVTLEAMGPSARAHLHLRRYRSLAAGDPDPFALLHHADGARGLLPVPERVAARLGAGRAAYARGAYAEAVRMLEAAAAEADHDEADGDGARGAVGAVDRLEIDLRLGLALAACGRLDAADALLDAVVADPGATDEQVIVAALGDELLGFRVVGDARRLARLEAAQSRSAAAAPTERIELLRGLLIEGSFVHDRPLRLDARAELDALVAAHHADLDATCRARLAAMEAREVVEQPIPAGERVRLAGAAHEAAVAAGRPILVLDARELLVSALLAGGRDEEVEDAWYALQQEADRVSRPRSQWAASLLPAAVALAQGQRADAERLAEQARAVGESLGIPDAMGAHGVHQVISHSLDGRLGELTDLIDLVIAIYPAIAAWSAVGALARAQAGDREAAIALLEQYLERRRAQTTRYFDRPGLANAALAAWLVGDEPTACDVARLIVEELPPDPDAAVVVGVGAGVLGPVDLYVALAHARLGDVDRAGPLVESAAALASRLGWEPWRGAAEALRALLAVTAVPDRAPPPEPGPATASSPLGLRRLP